jgi:autotransporter-associated beta strand protein
VSLNANATIDTNGNTVTVAGVISGGAGNALIKEGAGILNITSVSTYSGPTTINAGTLNIAEGASIASSSLLTVNSGGAVTGTGTTGAVLLGEGSELRPGNSPGILSTGNVTTTGGVLGTGIYMEIGGLTPGTQHDQIQTTGSITLNGGTLVVSLINAFVPTKDDVFWIWLNDGSDLIGGTPGWLTNLPDGTVFPVPDTATTDDAWQIHYNVDGDGSGAANDIRLTYIPEPSSAGLLLGFLSLIGLRRRRR